MVGLGNRLQGDEALGAIAVARLADELPADLHEDVELIDGGTLGVGLLPYLDGFAGLVLVDVIEAGSEPGTLVELDPAGLNPTAGALGVHELGVAELLGALRLLAHEAPRVRIIGLQPQPIGLGLELSEPLAAALPRLVGRVVDCLRAWRAVEASGGGSRLGSALLQPPVRAPVR